MSANFCRGAAAKAPAVAPRTGSFKDTIRVVLAGFHLSGATEQVNFIWVVCERDSNYEVWTPRETPGLNNMP